MNRISVDDRFDRPIFIISTPRSGSSLLFETLAQAPDLFTIGRESHQLIEGLAPFTPAARGWESNRLTAADAQNSAASDLAQAFYGHLKDRDGRPAAGRVRMLEKTPKNALRVPFLDAIWPDGLFVYLYRDPRQTLSSMMEAWRAGGFRTYARLPGWQGPPWSMVLVPGWERLNGLPLPNIVAEQWKRTTEALLDDLERLPRGRLRTAVYSEFVADPQRSIQVLAASLDLGWDRTLGQNLPLSRHTVSRPKADKWRAVEDVIGAVWPIVERADARARALVEQLKASSD